MAVTNFRPEVWSANILVALRNALVFGQAGVINRDYEGEIAEFGDTVHITSFGDPEVRDYTEHTDITWDELSDATRALIVDQAKYFAFAVDDIERRQALSGFIQETSRGAAYNLASAADSYVSGLMAADVDGGNQLDAVADPSPDDAYGLLVDLRTALTKANVPQTGRWVVVAPEFYAVLLKDDRFIRADASGTTEGLRNGVVGRAAGFDVMESNTTPAVTGGNTAVAGHPIATTFAEQIIKTEAIRLENQFGDGIRGLHVYGAKVTRPTALATADVTFS
jgi:hypothetical protein